MALSVNCTFAALRALPAATHRSGYPVSAALLGILLVGVLKVLVVVSELMERGLAMVWVSKASAKATPIIASPM